MAAATKRVARYIRVSTMDQRTALQADETASLIERRGWQLVDTYEDHGVSGVRDQRSALTRLLADARRGKFDCVVVWRTDRFFRSLRHLVVTLDELGAVGIDFVSATEPIDTTTPSGRLMLHLVAAFGEFERNVLIERTRAGAGEVGRRWGRGGGRG